MTCPLLDLLQRVRVNEVIFHLACKECLHVEQQNCVEFFLTIFSQIVQVTGPGLVLMSPILYDVKCSTMVLIQQYGCCVPYFATMLFNTRKRVFFSLFLPFFRHNTAKNFIDISSFFFL